MRNESKYRTRTLKPQIDTLRWSPEETKIAVNLYEQGAQNEDIAQTLNRLFKTGRTSTGVRAKMHMMGAKWGCMADAAALDPRMVRKHEIAAEGGRSRALQFDNRPEPWHPARDPKPMWLRMVRK